MADQLRKLLLRLSEEDLQRLDDWRRTQTVIPSRNEAVRTLLRKAIDVFEAKRDENMR